MRAHASKTRFQQRPQTGVTLVEVLVAILVLGLLVTLALPGYTRYRLKANRPFAAACLVDAQVHLENVYTRSSAYPADLAGAGLPAASFDCQGRAQYTISLEFPDTPDCPRDRCYRLLAAARGTQAPDGNLRLTYDASKLNPGERVKQEHQAPGSADWAAGWDLGR